VQRTVAAIRSSTTLPVLVGFGISSPAQAVEASRHADGVVVASTLMRDVLGGASALELGATIAAFRSALEDIGPGRGEAALSPSGSADRLEDE
jgi:tryptophan synthase alpha chain